MIVISTITLLTANNIMKTANDIHLFSFVVSDKTGYSVGNRFDDIVCGGSSVASFVWKC